MEWGRVVVGRDDGVFHICQTAAMLKHGISMVLLLLLLLLHRDDIFGREFHGERI